MQRIDTANKALNLFGAGKHGFKAGVPGTADRPTNLAAVWCNAVQEEIASVIEATDEPLREGSFDQLLVAIRYLAGAGNGFLTTVVFGDGVTDKSAELAAANSRGRPLQIFGVCVVATPTTIVVPIVDAMTRLFSDGSLVTIDNGQAVRPEWFGSTDGALDRAITALPAAGGVIELSIARYKKSGYAYGFTSAGKAISKPNVKIRGAKMPAIAGDCRSLTGGSVIEGMVLAYADNFEISNLGIDAGFTWLSANGGVAATGVTEALILSYPDEATAAAGALKRGARLHNVVGLCASPTAPVHAVIVGEGYADVVCTGEVVGCYGVHGVVIKSRLVKADTLTAYCNADDGVIVKSAAASTARAGEVEIGKIHVAAAGPFGWTPFLTASGGAGASVKFHAEGGSIDKVQIGQISASGHFQGVLVKIDGAYDVSNVVIGTVITDGTAGGSFVVNAPASAKVNRWHIGSLTSRNAPFALSADFYNSGSLSSMLVIDALYAVGCSYAAVAMRNQAVVTIGTLSAENCGSVFHMTGTPRLKVGSVQRGTTPVLYYTGDAGLQPTYGTGWGQLIGGGEFAADLVGGQVRLRGAIAPGSTNVCLTLPSPWRPSNDLFFLARGFNGAVEVPVPLKVGADGTVTVNPVAGGTGNVSNSLSLDGVAWAL